MKVVKQKYEILTPISVGGIEELSFIERAARTCYKSESHMTEDLTSAKKLIKSLIDHGHEAMLEHSILSVKFTCDRAIANEIVRHRLFSFAQESTRYVNYGGKDICFIAPLSFSSTSDEYRIWEHACAVSESAYNGLIRIGARPEEARSVLNNSLKTEIVVTGNYREWRHFLYLRTSNSAHPQIRALSRELLNDLYHSIPIIFDDIWMKNH